MGRRAAIVLYVLALVVTVVVVDILFLKHHFWARLIVNIGIVLVFGAVYFLFLKRLWTNGDNSAGNIGT